MMPEIKIVFTNNDISGSEILNNAIIGGQVVNASERNMSDTDKLIAGLKAAKNKSTDEKEKKCAEHALGLLQGKNKEMFWDFVKENLGTFVTGTFTNVIGGVFLEIVKAKFNL